jgi:hypothetical protein
MMLQFKTKEVIVIPYDNLYAELVLICYKTSIRVFSHAARFEIADRNALCGRNIADADGRATASSRNCGVNLNHT